MSKLRGGGLADWLADGLAVWLTDVMADGLADWRADGRYKLLAREKPFAALSRRLALPEVLKAIAESSETRPLTLTFRSTCTAPPPLRELASLCWCEIRKPRGSFLTIVDYRYTMPP